MAARSTWEGYLRLNLLSVPVKAYSATVTGKGKIGFHLIHAKCNSRIHYKKVCPIHGEVPNDEIVSGYEVADGNYILIDKDELSNSAPTLTKRSRSTYSFGPMPWIRFTTPIAPTISRPTARPVNNRTPSSAKSWRRTGDTR